MTDVADILAQGYQPPKTAARIRQYVNTHPSLSKAIQFNALGGAAFFGSDDNNKAQITDWLKGLK